MNAFVKTALLFVSISGVRTAFGEAKAIRGLVVDEEARPLADVSIEFAAKNANEQYPITDGRGAF